VYDTKYTSISARTAARTAAATAAAAAWTATAAALMRYVWHWVALGFSDSGGSN